MIFIDEEKELIIKGNNLIYFYAPWFILHKKMLFTIDQIKNDFPSVICYAVDLDYFKTLTKRFSIQSLPTVIFFKNKKELNRTNDIMSIQELKDILNDIYK